MKAMDERTRRETCEAARDLGRSLAVAGGAWIALLALWNGAPLWLACAYGAATLCALTSGARLGSRALEGTLVIERRAGTAGKEHAR